MATLLHVHAIEPRRLQKVRDTAVDEYGNLVTPFPATGDGEPLRCCLRYANVADQIMLISFAPFDHPSVWTEVGPIYIHADACAGYTNTTHQLPPELAHGPRVLRTYRADNSMNYEHNTVITDDAELEPIIGELLTQPTVATVHVRTLAPQCFLYAVTAET